MLSLLKVLLLCLLVRARRPPPPGAPSKPGFWLPPGKRLRCANWFPSDPCFYEETLWTQCYQPYDWKHMQYPNRRSLIGRDVDLDMNSAYENVSLASVVSVKDGSIDIAWTSDWLPLTPELGVLNDTEQNVDQTGIDSGLTDDEFAIKMIVPDKNLPNPPCCQWSQPCFDWVGKHPPGYAFDGDNNAEEYYKFVCCLVSWAATCGGTVPYRPRTIRAPPECTMPWGHERVNAWDI